MRIKVDPKKIPSVPQVQKATSPYWSRSELLGKEKKMNLIAHPKINETKNLGEN